MNLTKCNNGHYYDSDTYPSCPHCGSNSLDNDRENKTVNLELNDTDSCGETMDLDSYDPVTSDHSRDLDDSKTISIYQNVKVETPQMSPTVGWLVCTQGKFYGQDFRLKSGRNFIGRGSDMDICLSGENTVSRDRHATVIHEPRQNLFIAQPGESRELFYVNGNVVLSPVQLKKNDVMQIGEIKLMLIPCCDDTFQWEQEN